MLLTEAVNAKNDVMTSRGHVMGPTAVDTRRINLMTDIAVGIGSCLLQMGVLVREREQRHVSQQGAID
ncbi:hypothetical protein PC118_g15259 [Phytophthora cactorum]|uniref:Uncharacterized protein n=1 Tax=Phytophthora cactorum TaxID=29920 RepID=A0A8T1FR73_9STRA|nr:hypothetical protein PC118_g15259 [Phytophthora cactorum]